MTSVTAVKRKPSALFARKLRKQWELQLMVVPAIILIIVFSYLPIYGVLMAFQNYQLGDIPGFSQWVGLKQFMSFFVDPRLMLLMKNTLCISLLKLIITFPAPILFALMLNEMNSIRYKRIVQTISYLPHFVAYVVISCMFMDILSVNGSINELLVKSGIISDTINFFQNAKFFWPLLVISDLWKELGWGSILYLATIASVDVEQYEAAVIDGATRIKKIWYITLPSIKPTIVIMLIFAVSGLFNTNFEQIMLFTNQMRNTFLMDVADVVDTYVYRIGISGGRYSYSAAVGLFKNVLSFLLLLGANWVARKVSDESII